MTSALPDHFPREHFDYAADRVRTARFRSALAEAVVPGASVLDLGCGVGILGLLCLEAGAAHVTALDSTAAVELAREALVGAAGPERVSIMRAESGRARLDRRFDLVICDHVGYFGFDYGIVDLLRDARKRFLKPSGRLVPSALELFAAPVECGKARERVDVWVAGHVPPSLNALHRYGTNAKHSVSLNAGDLLAEPARLGRIDFHADEPETFAWRCEVRVNRPGRLDGLAGWFDCSLAGTVRMTNSPLEPGRIDRPQAFLPIAEPVAVEAGDTVTAEIVARPGEELIAWTVRHEPSGRRFRHSTFEGMIVTEADLRRQLPQHRPRLTPKARARATVLGYCDGARSRAEIEAAVMGDHPELFPTREATVRFIAEVLERDTE